MNDQEGLIKLYRTENKAMVGKDIATLNKILAPTMTLRHMTGTIQTKAEWLSQIQDEQMKYFSSKEDSIKDIHINGDHATLIGQNQVKARIWGGSINTWPLQMKIYFTKKDNEWIITKQEASMY